MKVDLNTLDFRRAFEIIDYCITHRVDYERALELGRAWIESPVTEHVWELDIPEELITYFLMKWDHE